MPEPTEFQVIQNLILFILIVGTIIFLFVCRRNRKLISWLLVYISATFAQMLTNLGFPRVIIDMGMPIPIYPLNAPPELSRSGRLTQLTSQDT